MHPIDPSSGDFRALFEEQVAFVWRVLRRNGVPERELEDACQEVFLIVHRKLPEFERRSSLRTWIYGIAARVALAVRRKRRGARELLDVPTKEPESAAVQEELAAHRHALAMVSRALSAMDAAKREVFVLYELEGMTVAEVASALGVPENTALYRLHRAREELERQLKRAALVSGTRVPVARVAGRRAP